MNTYLVLMCPTLCLYLAHEFWIVGFSLIPTEENLEFIKVIIFFVACQFLNFTLEKSRIKFSHKFNETL